MCAFYTFSCLHDSRFTGAARRRGIFTTSPLNVTWVFMVDGVVWGDISSLRGWFGVGVCHANSYWDVLGT